MRKKTPPPAPPKPKVDPYSIEAISAMLTVQEKIKAALLAAEQLDSESLEEVGDMGDKLPLKETLTRLYQNCGDSVIRRIIDAKVRLVAVPMNGSR